jgi:Tfp pilus assembly protein PilO
VSHSIWRRHLRGWLPPLLVFLAALGSLLFYRLEFAGEARAGGRQLERRTSEVAQLTEERQRTEKLVERLRENQLRIEEFRSQRLATEAERLTLVIAEVKDLARRAEVEPSSIRYPEERLEGVGLTQRSIVFSVDGDYGGLRRFINFLELSDLFLTLEEVSLSGRSVGESSKLRISLQVSTLFLDDRDEGQPVAGGATS